MNNTFQNTDYYNDIMSAYNAGLNSNTEQRDNLIRNLNNSLSDSCKTYTTNPNIITRTDPTNGRTITVDLATFSQKYKNDIEFQNSLKEQLLADEQTYFVNKYDANLYQYLISLRSEFTNNLNTEESDKICEGRTSTNTTNTNRITNTVTGQCDENGSCITSPSKCNDTGVDFYKMFSKYLPYVDPEVTNRKIEYRETEHDLLKKINMIMNWVYYVLFIIMIIILIGGKNLQLTQRAPIYIFLLILPLIYPYVFNIITYLYTYLTATKSIHGPKNAFLDSNKEDNMIDAYNN